MPKNITAYSKNREMVFIICGKFSVFETIKEDRANDTVKNIGDKKKSPSCGKPFNAGPG